MDNTFYQPFDLERFPDTPIAENDYRSAFQIERDRIIFPIHFDAFNQRHRSSSRESMTSIALA